MDDDEELVLAARDAEGGIHDADEAHVRVAAVRLPLLGAAYDGSQREDGALRIHRRLRVRPLVVLQLAEEHIQEVLVDGYAPALAAARGVPPVLDVELSDAHSSRSQSLGQSHRRQQLSRRARSRLEAALERAQRLIGEVRTCAEGHD